MPVCTHETVERCFVLELLGEPLEVGERSLVVGAAAAVRVAHQLEPARPFRGPHSRVFGTFEQRAHELRALVLVFAG